MGLDQYLNVRQFQSELMGSSDKELEKNINKSKNINREIKYIVWEGVYWRKANQIHKWFVDNVQSGEDDCREYFVDKTQLEELVELCKEVLKTRNPKLLPTQEGFFFGSTDYNEYYYEDIERTIKEITKLLDDTKDLKFCEFIYHSSW